MAMADYRQCDVCGEKTFYDANLNYETGVSEWGMPPFRVAGAEQYDKPELVNKQGARLGCVGDWAVVCWLCAKTHRVQIVPIADAQRGEGDA